MGDLVPYFDSARAQGPADGREVPVLAASDFAGAVCHNPILLDGPTTVAAGGAWLLSLLLAVIEDETRLAAPVAVIQIEGLPPGIRRAYLAAHLSLEDQPVLTPATVGAMVEELDRVAQSFLLEWEG